MSIDDIKAKISTYEKYIEYLKLENLMISKALNKKIISLLKGKRFLLFFGVVVSIILNCIFLKCLSMTFVSLSKVQYISVYLVSIIPIFISVNDILNKTTKFKKNEIKVLKKKLVNNKLKIKEYEKTIRKLNIETKKRINSKQLSNIYNNDFEKKHDKVKKLTLNKH